MKVIPPLEINSARLTSSTISEPSAGETAWVSGSGYAVGAQVIRTTTHRIYECLQTINAASGPSTALPENSPTFWFDAGATNKYAMFDLLRSTGSVPGSGTLTVVLTPGERINAVAVLGMVEVRELNITMTSASAGGVVYTKNRILRGRTSTGWYDYFFDELTFAPSIVEFDLPPYTDGVITIEFIGSSIMSVGACVVGFSEFIGTIQRKATNDALNFSTVTRDRFGNATMFPRRSVPKTNQTLFLQKELLNKVRGLRSDLNATPAVWCGLDDSTGEFYFEALLVLGFYRTFSFDIDNPIGVYVNLELEEI